MLDESATIARGVSLKMNGKRCIFVAAMVWTQPYKSFLWALYWLETWEESKRPSRCFSWCASLNLFICIDVFSGMFFFSSGFVLFQNLCHNMWWLIFQSWTCGTGLAVVPSSVTLSHPSVGSYTVQNLVAGRSGAWALLTVDFFHKKRTCPVHFKAPGAWLEKLICFLLTSPPSLSKTYSCMNKKFTWEYYISETVWATLFFSFARGCQRFSSLLSLFHLLFFF